MKINPDENWSRSAEITPTARCPNLRSSIHTQRRSLFLDCAATRMKKQVPSGRELARSNSLTGFTVDAAAVFDTD